MSNNSGYNCRDETAPRPRAANLLPVRATLEVTWAEGCGGHKRSHMACHVTDVCLALVKHWIGPLFSGSKTAATCQSRAAPIGEREGSPWEDRCASLYWMTSNDESQQSRDRIPAQSVQLFPALLITCGAISCIRKRREPQRGVFPRAI